MQKLGKRKSGESGSWKEWRKNERHPASLKKEGFYRAFICEHPCARVRTCPWLPTCAADDGLSESTICPGAMISVRVTTQGGAGEAPGAQQRLRPGQRRAQGRDTRRGGGGGGAGGEGGRGGGEGGKGGRGRGEGGRGFSFRSSCFLFSFPTLAPSNEHERPTSLPLFVLLSGVSHFSRPATQRGSSWRVRRRTDSETGWRRHQSTMKRASSPCDKPTGIGVQAHAYPLLGDAMDKQLGLP